MEKPKTITDSAMLEFVVFCIENTAIKLKKNAKYIYKILVDKTNILNDYIIPNYEILHTQDKNYIVNDIIEVMKENKIEL